MSAFTDASRLSHNQYTTFNWTVKESVEGCVRAGIPYVGLWRDKVKAQGMAETVKILQGDGIPCSSLCRGGWFPALSESDREEKIQDNLRAIDEAAELGTDTLVLVCGGLPEKDRDMDFHRLTVEKGIERALPYAKERGVKLGIEPLHPMQAAERSVISTLGQALDICERIGDPNLGVIIDVYHVWWDPDLYRQIERAKGRIWGFHVNDWLVPTNDTMMERGMMGDGVIELRRMREAVEAAGYSGPIECEIFNKTYWEMDGNDVLKLMKERFIQYC